MVAVAAIVVEVAILCCLKSGGKLNLPFQDENNIPPTGFCLLKLQALLRDKLSRWNAIAYGLYLGRKSILLNSCQKFTLRWEWGAELDPRDPSHSLHPLPRDQD